MTTQTLLGKLGEKMSAIRLDLSINGTAALFGLGYVIGLRYAAVIAAGSVFACLVLTPLIFHFGSQIPHFVYAGKTYVIAEMDSEAIFDAFVQSHWHRRYRCLRHYRHHPHGQDRRQLHLAWLQGSQGWWRGGGPAHADRYVSPQRRYSSSSDRRF